MQYTAKRESGGEARTTVGAGAALRPPATQRQYWLVGSPAAPAQRTSSIPDTEKEEQLRAGPYTVTGACWICRQNAERMRLPNQAGKPLIPQHERPTQEMATTASAFITNSVTFYLFRVVCAEGTPAAEEDAAADAGDDDDSQHDHHRQDDGAFAAAAHAAAGAAAVGPAADAAQLTVVAGRLRAAVPARQHSQCHALRATRSVGSRSVRP